MSGNIMLFQLVPGDLSDLKKQNNYNSSWKKLLGFRNLQEKLENIISEKRKATNKITFKQLKDISS